VSDDPFCDFLRLVEARSFISGGFAAGGRWALRFPAPKQVVFSAIVRGACWFRLEGEREGVRAEQGDVALLPGRRGFILASSLSVPPTDVPLADRSAETITIGDGSDCMVLAGRVLQNPSTAALLTDALPDLVHVRGSSPRAASLQWILEQLVSEQTSTLPGSKVASAQLAQLLFTQILRTHIADAGAATLPAGWLRAIGDPRIFRALRLMHDAPGRALRLEDLAKAAGMSRTRFAVQFKAVAGVAPLTYLAEWRMRLAERRLTGEDTSIAALSSSLGYASESAFSNAFKRVTGVAPGKYRSATRGPSTRPP
jgi:AraC-like DNA-binding protein